MTTVELEEAGRISPTNLTVEGETPYAPLTFSWKCSKSLVFKSDTITLTLENVQVRLIRYLSIGDVEEIQEVFHW